MMIDCTVLRRVYEGFREQLSIELGLGVYGGLAAYSPLSTPRRLDAMQLAARGAAAGFLPTSRLS